jgi:branched-chain amino acid transport system permease protein
VNEIFGYPAQALYSQLLIGLVNGGFYALLSLGLALIFGLLNIINFTHGAQYMLGAFCAWLLLTRYGIGYWWALLLAPLLVGLLGAVIERVFLRRLYKLDHLYGLLLTFGLALVLEGLLRNLFGTDGQPYAIPEQLAGAQDLGFMHLPNYRAWVLGAAIAQCLATWLVIEKTRLGAYLRAATENPMLVRAFGINVPRMITITYACGVGLAAFSGVMAAPIYQVSPLMGGNILIVVFAVVVIGGMGSLAGAVFSGFGLGLVEGVTKLLYPQASNVVIFAVMAAVLLFKPAGLFGKDPR